MVLDSRDASVAEILAAVEEQVIDAAERDQLIEVAEEPHGSIRELNAIERTEAGTIKAPVVELLIRFAAAVEKLKAQLGHRTNLAWRDL